MVFSELMAMLLVALIFIYGLMRMVSASTKRALVANAPPGASVTHDDDAAEARVKIRQYHLLLRSMRIFHELIQRDEVLGTTLPPETRERVEKILSEFYE